MEAYIGTVMTTAIQYAPRGWMLCQGQTLSIAQYSALFSLLGTTYGGNGQSTFMLPNLCGRMAVGTGTGVGLSPRPLGAVGGTETTNAPVSVVGAVKIDVTNLPSHTHSITDGTCIAKTAVKVGTASVGTPTPVEGAGLSVAPTGPMNAGIWASPAPTTDIVGMGNVATTMSGSVDATGSGANMPFTANGNVTAGTMSPFLALNYIICVDGIFPSRN
jgi:microcystin-dependent protein